MNNATSGNAQASRGARPSAVMILFSWTDQSSVLKKLNMPVDTGV